MYIYSRLLARLQKVGETWIRVILYALLHRCALKRARKPFVRRCSEFSQGFYSKHGTGRLKYRAPDPGVPIVW